MNFLHDKIRPNPKPFVHYCSDNVQEGDLTYNSTTKTATGTLGSNTLVFNNNTDLQRGLFIALSSPVGEKAKITNINGTTITVDITLSADYTDTDVFIGGLSTLNDLSGNEHHLTQTTAAFQPILINDYISNRKALFFDGSDDFMDVVFSKNQPFTLYFYGFPFNGSNGFLFSGLNNNYVYIRNTNTNPQKFEMTANHFDKISIDNTPNEPNNRLIAAVFNTTNSLLEKDRKIAQGDIGTLNLLGFSLFRLNSPALSFCRGYFLEIRLYDGIHDFNTRRVIEKEILTYYGR